MRYCSNGKPVRRSLVKDMQDFVIRQSFKAVPARESCFAMQSKLWRPYLYLRISGVFDYGFVKEFSVWRIWFAIASLNITSGTVISMLPK
jgi:hypothetical protein